MVVRVEGVTHHSQQLLLAKMRLVGLKRRRIKNNGVVFTLYNTVSVLSVREENSLIHCP